MRPRSRWVVVAAGGCVLAAAAVAWVAPRAGGANARRDVARERIDAALTAVQLGEEARAQRLLRDAWAAAPSSLKPLLALANIGSPNAHVADVRRSIDSIALAHGDALLPSCTRALLAGYASRDALEGLARSAHPLTRACAALLRGSLDANSTLALPLEYRDLPMWIDQYGSRLAETNPGAAWAYAQRIIDSPTHPLRQVAAYNVAIPALHRLGRHDEAAALEREAEVRSRAWGPGAYARVMHMLSRHADMLEEMDAPDSVSNHAHAVAERAGALLDAALATLDVSARVSLLHQHASFLLDGGKLRDAASEFERLAALADTLDDVRLRGNVRARLGRTMSKLGALQRAEPLLRSARELALANDDVVTLRESSHDLLHLYESTGRVDAAAAAGLDFATYSDRMVHRPGRMMAHHDLGWLFRRNGRLRDAERSFSQMIADIDTLGMHTYWAGEYYEYTGQLEQAREYYLRPEAAPRERARKRAGIVRVSEALGEAGTAERFAQLADRDTGTWFPEYAPMWPAILARTGRTRQARERYELERARARVAGRAQTLAQIALESAELERQLGDARVAKLLADSAADAAELTGATEVAVRARALAAAVRLEDGEPRTPTLALLDAAVRRGERMRMPQLSAELHLLRGDALLRIGDRRRALAAYDIAAGWLDSVAAYLESDPARAGYRANHVRVSNRALRAVLQEEPSPQRLERYWAWSARRKRGVRHAGAPPTSLAAARRALARDAALVDYVVLDTSVAALVMRTGAVWLHPLPVTADSLRARITRFRAPIAPAVGSAVDVTRIGFDSSAARQLYRDLIAPLAQSVRGVRRLIIAPDGWLHSLPFDALLSGSAPSTFLMDQYAVRYVTSPAIPPRRRRPSSTRRGALAVGMAVGASQAGAADEIRAVREALGAGASVVQGTAATVDSVAARAPHVAILHFATHAEANDVNPDFARLALAPGEGNDGWLHAFEIRQWNLDGALVVLSACQTAAGRLTAGAGTLSLSRAFLQAGADATIATLWPIGAPTASLMQAFYEALASDMPIEDALRQARLRLRAGGHDHPFYWAPFILTTWQP